MIYPAKGRFNCDVCGRFAWLVEISETDCGPEQWGAWCKAHAPRWARDWHAANEAEEAAAKGGPAPGISTQSAGCASDGTSCAANVQRSSP